MNNGVRLYHEVLEFVHDGHRYTASSGRFEDGRVAEIFLDAGKAGTRVEAVARDAVTPHRFWRPGLFPVE
jgi:hypothetical protein